jgi:hypothetical protein
VVVIVIVVVPVLVEPSLVLELQPARAVSEARATREANRWVWCMGSVISSARTARNRDHSAGPDVAPVRRARPVGAGAAFPRRRRAHTLAA